MRQSKKSKNEEKKVMKRKKTLKITKKLQNKSKKLRQKIDLHLANWGRTWKATINEKKKQTRKREKERTSHVQFVVLVEFCGSKMNVNLRGIATVKSVDRLATCMDLFNYFFFIDNETYKSPAIRYQLPGVLFGRFLWFQSNVMAAWTVLPVWCPDVSVLATLIWRYTAISVESPSNSI